MRSLSRYLCSPEGAGTGPLQITVALPVAAAGAASTQPSARHVPCVRTDRAELSGSAKHDTLGDIGSFLGAVALQLTTGVDWRTGRHRAVRNGNMA